MKHTSTFLTGVILPFSAFLAFAGASPASAEAMFMGLGDLPGGDYYSEALAVSPDGSVVVGAGRSASGPEAFRWENGVMVGLGDLPGGGFNSIASAVSSNGSVIVGSGDAYPRFFEDEAFRWEAGVMQGLGNLAGDPSFNSFAEGVSADGAVVVGRSTSPSADGLEAFRWEDGVMVGLGDLPGGRFASAALDVSADGSVIVGGGTSETGGEAFRWTSGGDMVGLGGLAGGGSFSVAYGVSADGSVVVGEASSTFGQEAFRWEDGVMVGLGDLPGGEFLSQAFAVSADGSVIVGSATVCQEFECGVTTFIWDAVNGMRKLRDVLANDFGLDLGGWMLNEAGGAFPRGDRVSDDGRTIVGTGTNPDGRVEAWIAVLDSTIAVEVNIKPGSDPNSVNLSEEGVIPVAILGSVIFDVMDVDLTTLAFGPDGAAPAHCHGPHVEDVDGDGFLDMIAHYATAETGIVFGDMEACITGETLDGTPFEGCDTVRTVPDMDGDGLLDLEEATFGTDALNPDSDGDGFTDGDEIRVMGTNPLNAYDPRPAKKWRGKGRRR